MFLYWAKNESYHITNNWLANQVNVDIHHDEIVKYLMGYEGVLPLVWCKNKLLNSEIIICVDADLSYN